MSSYLAWSNSAAAAQETQRVTAATAQKDGEVALADSERDASLASASADLAQAVAVAGAAQAAGLAQAGAMGTIAPTGMYNTGFPSIPTVALPAGYAVAAASSGDYYVNVSTTYGWGYGCGWGWGGMFGWGGCGLRPLLPQARCLPALLVHPRPPPRTTRTCQLIQPRRP